MSKKRDNYYNFKNIIEGKNLEMQKLKKQNEELIELLDVVKDRIEDFEYDVNLQSCIADTIEETLEKIKQKPIKEISK